MSAPGPPGVSGTVMSPRPRPSTTPNTVVGPPRRGRVTRRVARPRALVVAGNELRRLFRSPLAFLFAALFLFLTGYAGMAAVLATREATARYAINSMAVLFLIAVPVLTMRSLSEERSSSRLDFLFASPASTTEIVVGKFLGAYGFASLLVAAAMGVQLVPVLRSGNPDAGEMLAGFVGLELFVAAAVAVAMLWSSWSASVLVAGLGGTVTLLVLWFAGATSQALPGLIGRLAEQAAWGSRLEPFTFGLIRTDHFAYFLATVAVALAASVAVLDRSRPPCRTRRRFLRRVPSAWGLAAVAVVAGIVTTSYPTRVDLTAGHRLSLSTGTREVLSHLTRTVEVMAFVDPTQPDYREVRNLVRLYAANSRQVRVQFVNVAKDPQVAARYGVQQPGEIIMKSGGREQWASRATEDRLTVALARLSAGSSGLVCRAAPAGAASASPGWGAGPQDHGRLRGLLVSSGFDLAEMSGALPKGCDVVVVLGSANLGDDPFGALHRSGARALLLLAETTPDGALGDVLVRAGLGVGPGLLSDVEAGTAGDPGTVLARVRTRTGTELAVALPGVAPVRVKDGAVVAESAASAVEVNEAGEIAPDAQPASRPVAAVGQVGTLRVGVIGDTDFAKNAFLRVGDNGEFLLEMVARLQGREPVVRVTSRRVGLAETSLLLSEKEARTAKWYTTILVPLSCLIMGLLMNLRRRER